MEVAGPDMDTVHFFQHRSEEPQLGGTFLLGSATKLVLSVYVTGQL